MKKLAGKTALVTGGSSGLGLATARAFSAEGARLIITGQDTARLESAGRELGENTIAIRADVRNLPELAALAEKVREKAPEGLDVLFANAGVAYFAPVDAVDEEHFDSQFDVNVKGLFFTVQKLLPLVRDNASIILNATFGTVKGIAGGSVYFATKAAVRSLARTFAVELAGRGIRVNALSPGLVPTSLFGKTGLSQEQLEGLGAFYTQRAPLGRLGAADEIASAAVFLASSDSSFMTGGDLVIDGGIASV